MKEEEEEEEQEKEEEEKEEEEKGGKTTREIKTRRFPTEHRRRCFCRCEDSWELSLLVTRESEGF